MIASKLEMQRNRVQQLQSAMQQSDPGTSETAAAQLEVETLRLKELELQFNKTYSAQRDFILEQDKAAKSMQKSAKEMDLRKAGPTPRPEPTWRPQALAF